MLSFQVGGNSTAITSNFGGVSFFRSFHFPYRCKSDKSHEGSGNDSIWAAVGSCGKWYRVDFDYVLYNLSYANFILYGAVIPSCDERNSNEDVIDSRDPRNKERLEILFDKMI